MPAEKDLVLNKAMYRLLEKGVESKFQDSQINLSHVSALIHKNRFTTPILPSTSDPNFEEDLGSVYVVIPPDFYWLANSRVEIVSDPVNCDFKPALPTSIVTEFINIVPFPSGGSAPYYANTSIVSSIAGNLYFPPATITTGFNSPNSKYVVVNNILEQSYRRVSTIKVYWERYRDTFYKDSFIFVSPTTLGTITITSGAQVSASAGTNTNYTTYNRSLISNLTNKTVRVVSTKNAESDSLYSTLTANPFYGTSTDEVITTQTHDYFIIYEGENFIVTRYYYDYIRKPRAISLALGQSCELADTTHQRLVDLAVEILRLDTQVETYQATVQNTQLRT